jgi:alpha-L-rhamnosidase
MRSLASGWICVALLALAAATAAKETPGKPVRVSDLRCESKQDPVGIDARQPHLSWRISGDRRGILQKAYEVRAAASPQDLKGGENLLWSTGRVDSDQSQHVAYKGKALASQQRVYWQARVWDEAGKPSPWSDPAHWEMGLLAATDWKADWIEPVLDEDPKVSNPSPMLRREFDLRGPVAWARAYVTAHGVYEAELNGRRVGDELLTPGWTAYKKRLQYQTYDVTRMLRPGRNAVGVTLGDGWYRGFLGFRNGRHTYGDRVALLMQIHVRYADGKAEVLGSDVKWKASTGPIRASDIYHGETYDARLEKKGWSAPGFDESGWGAVRVVDHAKDNLVAPIGPPVKRIQEVKPVEILKTPAGDTVFDMGQNMVGWIRLRVSGPAGTTVTLRHAEVLDKAGNFYVENLRTARQTVQYTLRGGGVEVFEPHFTFQGFRYVAVAGLPAEPSLDVLTGVVVHSEIAPTGTFVCSDPLLNQLQKNIQWGQKGNFVDVPTDCPQRDERLGWTGDAQAFAPTACFNADVAGFFARWLKDLAADQQESGAVPHVIPDILSGPGNPASASAGWADAAVVVPWTHYVAYGDPRILEDQYASMKAWVEYQKRQAGDTYLWTKDFTFGDWLAFATTRSDYPGATTDKDLIMTAYFARSTDLLRRAAQILGKKEDAQSYGALLDNIKRAFVREYVTPSGRLASNTQTAYSLALGFGLLPEPLRRAAAGRLAEDVRKFKHITTGFLGTPLICPVLSDYGYWDEAFTLINRKEYPSWLYPVTKGATTIWERWDGLKPDGTFQDKGMNSFNHYAYGAIGDWLYQRVAGLRLDETRPAYKHSVIQPHPGGGLTSARANHVSVYGPVSSGWEVAGGQMKLDVEVPANTTATVHLPKAAPEKLTEGGQPIDKAVGVLSVHGREGETILEVGSGKYSFAWPLP